MLYKVFVDDSGEKEYSNVYPYDFNLVANPPSWNDALDYWRRNYFVLCGIRVEATNIPIVDEKINRLKIKYFGTKDIEIKSTWLRDPKKREAHYIKPYGITNDEVLEFGTKFLDLICSFSNEIKIISCIFDKRCIKRRAIYTPITTTTQLLLERIHYKGGKNVVVFDQMDSSLHVTSHYNKKMVQVFSNNIGVERIFVEKYSNILDFVPGISKKENFLQIADACAYAVHKQFMKFGREWLGERKNENGESLLTPDKVFEQLRFNFDCHPVRKSVVGSGIILYPHKKDLRVNWNINSKKK